VIQLRRLWLSNFRNYREASLELSSGTTAVVGANGQGKTNLVEAIAHLAGTALRGATSDTMIGLGTDRAIVRAEAVRGERELLIEAELLRSGRNRIQVNRQPVRRARDLAEALVVTVFAPDDLDLVKGGPAERRRYLDDAIVALDPRLDPVRAEVDKALRQRNALLKQVSGRLDEGAAVTLDVWDDRLGQSGDRLLAARRAGLDELGPWIAQAYRDVAGRELPVTAREVRSSGEAGLAGALAAARREDVRRGVTTVGPHRDDVELCIDGRPTRTHASQGEQRSLALALRLAVHRALTDRMGHTPILLLDDVCSELDDGRTERLLGHLPAGQTLLTTASTLPPQANPDRIVRIEAGTIVP
jgi:DNA replication and repair protein RecF